MKRIAPILTRTQESFVNAIRNASLKHSTMIHLRGTDLQCMIDMDSMRAEIDSTLSKSQTEKLLRQQLAELAGRFDHDIS